MKIAFFSDILIRDYDGCLRTIFHIIDRTPEDVEIKYFTGRNCDEGLNSPYVPVPNLTIPFNKSYKMAFPELVTRRLKKELDEFNPDIVHITTPSNLGGFAQRYAEKNNIKVSSIYHTHYVSYLEYYLSKVKIFLPFAKWLMNKGIANFYNRCDLVLVPTIEMLNHLKNSGVNKRNNLVIWRRGLDHKIFGPNKRDESRLRELIGNDYPNILFASRLVWEKNLKTLINIYNKFDTENIPVNFVVAGDGVAFEELNKRMPKAYFTGKLSQKELAFFYASCDAFVFPSVSETYGNVIIEAMASGLPCVVSDKGGPKEFIIQNKNGFIVDAYDVDQYCFILQKILNDHELRKSVQKEGIEYTKSLDWDTLVKDYFDQLKSII